MFVLFLLFACAARLCRCFAQICAHIKRHHLPFFERWWTKNTSADRCHDDNETVIQEITNEQWTRLFNVNGGNAVIATLLLLLSLYVEGHSEPDCLYIWQLIKTHKYTKNSQNLVRFWEFLCIYGFVATEQDFCQFSSTFVCLRISDA